MSTPDRAITANTQRRTPRWVFLLRQLIALVILVPIPYAAVMLLAPVPSTAATEQSIVAAVGAPATITSGDVIASAFWVEGLEGAHAEYGSTESLPTASVAKVITILAVLDAFPIAPDERGPLIPIGDQDVQFIETVSLDLAPAVMLQVGDEVHQRDLIEWALVASAANATLTLGTWAFGSEQGAIDATNAWVAEQGFTGTAMADLNGLSYGTVSTAAELVQIGRLAMQDPVLAATVAMPQVTVPGGGIEVNTNRMLGDAGVTGIKTGTLFDFGRNLLVAATQEIGGTRYQVVMVILGAVSIDVQYGSARDLLASVWPNIQQVELVPEGTVVGSYETLWGDAAEVVTADPVSAWVWGDTPATVEVELDDVGTELRGTDVGDVTVTVNGEDVVVDAELDSAIDAPDAWWRLTHPAEIEPFGLFR